MHIPETAPSSAIARAGRRRDDTVLDPIGGKVSRWGETQPLIDSGYSAAAADDGMASTRAAQNLNSGILPNGSSCGLVSRLAAASV